LSQVALAFFIPALVGSVAKDVLEPLFIGNAASLEPIAVMLAILLWGSAWGITGARCITTDRQIDGWIDRYRYRWI